MRFAADTVRTVESAGVIARFDVDTGAGTLTEVRPSPVWVSRGTHNRGWTPVGAGNSE